MHDALLVRVADAVEGLKEERQRLFDLEASGLLHQGGEGPPVDELHHHQQRPLVIEQAVEDRDVRVVEPGEGAGLGAEALEHLGLGGEVGAQGLDGHRAAERQVGGLEDLADAAFPDLSQDSVVADGLADHERSPSAPAQAVRMLTRYRTAGGAP